MSPVLTAIPSWEGAGSAFISRCWRLPADLDAGRVKAWTWPRRVDEDAHTQCFEHCAVLCHRHFVPPLPAGRSGERSNRFDVERHHRLAQAALRFVEVGLYPRGDPAQLLGRYGRVRERVRSFGESTVQRVHLVGVVTGLLVVANEPVQRVRLRQSPDDDLPDKLVD